MLKKCYMEWASSILEITTILSVRKHLMVNIIRKCGDCNGNGTTKGGVSKVHGDTSALLCFMIGTGNFYKSFSVFSRVRIK